MKNFKIIISIIIVVGIGGWIFTKNITNNSYEKITYENICKEDDEEISEEFIVLHITGEVKNEGVIKLKEGARIIDAIDVAGGLTQNADVSKINLAFLLSDGQKIYIPSIYDEEVKEYVIQDSGVGIVNLQTNKKININTATQTELEAITGIGPSTALKIINYRKENGKFKKTDDIKNVSGIGDAKYEIIKDEICV